MNKNYKIKKNNYKIKQTNYKIKLMFKNIYSQHFNKQNILNKIKIFGIRIFI